MALRRNAVRLVLRSARPLFASRHLGVAGRRLMLATVTAAVRDPKAVRYERVTIAGVPVEMVRPTDRPTDATLIYLHGGGYALGSARGYRAFAAHIAATAGMTALVPDYTRVPQARYPLALGEMVAVYSRLLADGLNPRTTVIAGDSAGGGLTLALAMELRDRGIPGPAALGLICPWADLALDIERGRPMTPDPLILPSMCAEWAPHYVGSADPRAPGVSPAWGDMSGLPPIVMQSAGDDPIHVDADRIETACAVIASARLDHRRFDDLWHDFQLQVSLLPEAREAVADLAMRLRDHVRVPTEQRTEFPTDERLNPR